MIFEWDSEKELRNIAKHKIDFSTAALVFGDEDRLELFDIAHSYTEMRYITIGRIRGTVVVLVVVYTERGDRIRIISARKANSREEGEYYAGY